MTFPAGAEAAARAASPQVRRAANGEWLAFRTVNKLAEPYRTPQRPAVGRSPVNHDTSAN
jgi:hypothetical protein